MIKNNAQLKQKLFLTFIFGFIATLTFFAIRGMIKVNAAEFWPGNVFSDNAILDYNSMNESDIYNFLKSKGNCGNYNTSQTRNNTNDYRESDFADRSWHVRDSHYVCLADEMIKVHNTDADIITPGGYYYYNFSESNANYDDDGNSDGYQTAAHIIYRAAQDFHVNPQFLISLLQKEQGLISDSLPNSYQYRAATGYGCNGTTCKGYAAGFRNQVRWAASFYRDVLSGAKTGSYHIGWNTLPSGETVNIENLATASLYIYTPTTSAAQLIFNIYSGWFGDTHRPEPIGETVRIPDGIYTIRSKANNQKVIEIAGGLSAKNDTANVQIYQANDLSSQEWSFTYDASYDAYSIKNVNADKSLDLYGASQDAGANVSIYQNNNTCAQRWKIYHTPDNYYSFVSMCSWYALDLQNGDTKNSTNIRVWHSNNTDAQKWELRSTRIITDGVYRITAKDNIQSVVEVSGGLSATNNGANVQIYQNNGLQSQEWVFTHNDKTGNYTIKNAYTGKLLDVSGASTQSGANVQVWEATNSCAQEWKAVYTPDGYYTLVSTCSGKALDLSNNDTKNSNNIRIWGVNNASAEKWAIIPAATIPNGTYTIKAKDKNTQVIEIANGVDVKTPGANVRLWQDNEIASQEWTFTYDYTTGYYNIKNMNSNRSLDVENGSGVSGTNIRIWSHNDSCAQKWRVVRNTAGYYTFIAACSNMALDLENNNTKNGSNIRLWAPNNTSAQQWILESPEALPEGSYTFHTVSNTSQIIEVAGGLAAINNGSNVQIYNNNNIASQHWSFIEDPGSKSYLIKNINNGKYLDISDVNSKYNANAQIWERGNPCSQRWQIIKTTDNYYSFMSPCSNRVLDLLNGDTSNNTNIRLYDSNNTIAQKWVIQPVDTISTGVYIIKAQKNPHFVLSGTGSTGANIQLNSFENNDSQKWSISKTSDDHYQITNLASDKRLDAANGGTIKDTNIRLWDKNTSCAEKWDIVKNPDKSYTILSLCSYKPIDITNDIMSDGTNIRLWKSNNTSAQKWSIEKISG